MHRQAPQGFGGVFIFDSSKKIDSGLLVLHYVRPSPPQNVFLVFA